MLPKKRTYLVVFAIGGIFLGLFNALGLKDWLMGIVCGLLGTLIALKIIPPEEW